MDSEAAKTADFAKRRPAWLPFLVLALALLVALLAACAFGTVAIPWSTAGKILVHRATGIRLGEWTATQEVVVSSIRLPRALVAALAGGGLAISGCLMQGVFRNPLADPGVLGVSSGASLGAVCSLGLGWATKTALALPACAFIGALACGGLVYAASTVRGRPATSTLLLAGIAVGSFATAMSAAILSVTVSQFEVSRQILVWLLGGFDGKSWLHVKLCLPTVAIGSMLAMFFARDLNVLATGEDAAWSLGIDVSKVRAILLLLASLITATTVAVGGSIAFVGLIVPHMLRRVLGSDHRLILPASLLGGGVLLCFADTLSRWLSNRVELRVGVLTSLIGAPFFLYLLLRRPAEVAGE